MKWFVFVVSFTVLVSLLGCSNKKPEVIDLSPSAFESGDWTMVFRGCSQGPKQGYLFCRVWEDNRADYLIDLTFPSVDCIRENCIEILVLGTSGEPVFQIGLPKGENKTLLPLTDMISSNIFQGIHDGEYRVIAKIWYTDGEGREFMGQMKGVIRLLVLNAAYNGLACDDPDRGWVAEVTSTCRAEFSTEMRSTLCGSCI